MDRDVEALAGACTTERVELAVRRIIDKLSAGSEFQPSMSGSIRAVLGMLADELARDKKHRMGG
jgi:hypothetical protein